jgi:hypothetical protein
MMDDIVGFRANCSNARRLPILDVMAIGSLIDEAQQASGADPPPPHYVVAGYQVGERFPKHARTPPSRTSPNPVETQIC